MRFNRAPPRKTGGVSPSQFSLTRRHAAGDSVTSPAVAIRINVAVCWKGPPSDGPRDAAAAVATAADVRELDGNTASHATTTSRSAESIARLTTESFSFDDFSGFSFLSLSSTPTQLVPIRISDTRPNPTAAVTEMATGIGFSTFSSKSFISKSSSERSSPLDSSPSIVSKTPDCCGDAFGPLIFSVLPDRANPPLVDLYLANVAPALANPEADARSTDPDPSSTLRRPDSVSEVFDVELALLPDARKALRS